MHIKIARLNGNTMPLPQYATLGASGLDLHSACYAIIAPGATVCIATGIAMEIPFGYEGQVRMRSSWGRNGLIIPNAPGTIDSDYRGEIMVLVSNASNVPIRIEKGDRIAQLIIAPVVHVELQEVESLYETARGAGGFGSTGRK